MLGQSAADEAFAFYLFFEISAAFFCITLWRFSFCEKYIIVFFVLSYF